MDEDVLDLSLPRMVQRSPGMQEVWCSKTGPGVWQGPWSDQLLRVKIVMTIAWPYQDWKDEEDDY